MRDSLSKQELKILRAFKKGGPFGVSIDYVAGSLELFDGTVFDTVKKFIDLNLLAPSSLSELGGSEKKYRVTTEGESVLDKKNETDQEKIFWNVVIPMVVSIITSAVVSYLSIN